MCSYFLNGFTLVVIFLLEQEKLLLKELVPNFTYSLVVFTVLYYVYCMPYYVIL